MWLRPHLDLCGTFDDLQQQQQQQQQQWQQSVECAYQGLLCQEQIMRLAGPH
jgi:hypothetical protein